MSKLNKPENMNASLKWLSSLDRYQYQFDGFNGDVTVTAPIGSFAWALSHVYVRKQLLYRTGWHVPKEHIRLSHQSVANSEGDGSAYIEKSDKDGYWLPWKPTQEDLMAYDWKIMIPELYWISFDLKIGSYSNHGGEAFYGGYTTEEIGEIGKMNVYWDLNNNVGTLSNIQNKTIFKEITGFVNSRGFEFGLGLDGSESIEPYSYILILIVSCNEDNCQKTVELLSKDLYVTVDDRIYELYVDKRLFYPKVNGNTIMVLYESETRQVNASDVWELNKMMDGNIGRTKHFRLSWLDK
ncbi:Thoeris anti-defense Tad2 family protein [Xenorhabdus thuongxuanensis]|uniref:Uncharacterized protein n=1 Tax=Xenorhabdus thuongxuanensis TaxID=1873484 RepID=A0A1Q5TSI4_9GAMM|nr:MW1434 family type I TA system toxin [Xenorhabdus thuongxuanensis]OKP03185.1 hypothetical protein Xentx_03033 [Xenorhabdus thuongxuanensis]